MRSNVISQSLSPLERLRLRETMQDLWRDQVRRITLLSLAMHDDPDAEEPTPLVAESGDPAAIEAALGEARELLDHLEVAMHRLDAGSYGRCDGCGGQVGYADLVADPLATSCARCSVLAPAVESLPDAG
jgi:RNA polymerase-binding transcription factor DksA